MSRPVIIESAPDASVGGKKLEARPEAVLDRQFGIWSAVALGVMCGCAWPLFGSAIVSYNPQN